MVVYRGSKEKPVERSEDERKDDILSKLRQESLSIICLAYMYAKNFEETGIDITERWATMEQQNKILQEIYNRGYEDGLRKIYEDHSDADSNHVNGGVGENTISESSRNVVQPANGKNRRKGKGKRHRR